MYKAIGLALKQTNTQRIKPLISRAHKAIYLLYLCSIGIGNMINRLLIRTRVLQTAYAHFHREEQKLTSAEAELKVSLTRTYDLYLFLLRLIPELTERYDAILEVRRTKHLASPEERNPNKRLVNNRLAQKIDECAPIELWYNSFPLAWSEEDILLRQLINQIEGSELYKGYLEREDSFANDRTFWVEVFNSIIAPHPLLAEYLESQSVYWDDELSQTEKAEFEEHPGWEELDTAFAEARSGQLYSSTKLSMGAVEIVKDFVAKTLKRIDEELSMEEVLLPAYRDADDEVYAQHLMRQLLLGHKKHVELIEQHISDGWDKERLADMDMILMQMAIVEFLHFPSIPTHVSINEYVELSKIYSTPKSASFVNGVLDAVAKALKSEGKILKQ